jgi:hypothetical protein
VCEVVELASAIVVNDDHQAIAAQGFNLEFAPDAGKSYFTD